VSADREKKIPRTGSSSSATGQDKRDQEKRDKDPRDKSVSVSNERRSSREDKEPNNNNNVRGHKEREYEGRAVIVAPSQSRDERASGSRGLMTKDKPKESDNRDSARPRRLDRSYGAVSVSIAVQGSS
jgi:hypothetical protein